MSRLRLVSPSVKQCVTVCGGRSNVRLYAPTRSRAQGGKTNHSTHLARPSCLLFCTHLSRAGYLLLLRAIAASLSLSIPPATPASRATSLPLCAILLLT